ncbi:MAG TPA: T9SS type A sorting domain-containing protein [Bacteroidia bacterium]|nr:T9SS type A sorting domain-containing protein [Bacteroidia bacterium]
MKIISLAASPLIKNIGDVDEMVFELDNISNNGAVISQINIKGAPGQTISYLQTNTFHGGYYISNSSGTPSGTNIYTYLPPTGNSVMLYPTGNPNSFSLTQTEFNYFFNAPVLSEGQTLYIHIPYEVVNCTTSGLGATDTFTTGCSATPCTSQDISPVINILTGDPRMTVTGYTSPNNATFCPAAGGSNATMGFVYKNTGTPIAGGPAGNAIATHLQIFLLSDASLGTPDITKFKISDGVNTPISLPSSVISIVSPAPAGSNLYLIDFTQLTVGMLGNWNIGANSLADLNGDGKVDDLAEGNGFTITVEYNYNTAACPAFGTCGSVYMNVAMVTSQYNNQCFTIPQTDGRQDGYYYGRDGSYTYVSNSLSSTLAAPSDVQSGQPFNLVFTPRYYQQWGPVGYDFACPKGYHVIHIPLPLGIHLDPGTGSNALTPDGSGGYFLPQIVANFRCAAASQVIIPDAKEIPQNGCTPGYIDINLGRITAANCSGAYEETYDLPIMNIPLMERCDANSSCVGSNFGVDNFNATLTYVCDPSCSTCSSDLTCASSETYHHCPGCCISYFLTNPDFAMKRATLGDLNPQTYYDCTTASAPQQISPPLDKSIDLTSAYPGDDIEVISTGKFICTPQNTGCSESLTSKTGLNYSSIALQIAYDQFPAGVVPAGYDAVFDLDKTKGSIIITNSVTGAQYTVDPNNMVISSSVAAGRVFMNIQLDAGSMAFMGNVNPADVTSTVFNFNTDIFLIPKTTPFYVNDPGYASTFFSKGVHDLINLRAQYVGAETGTAATLDQSCDSWGAPFTIEQPTTSVAINSGVIQTTCKEDVWGCYLISHDARFGEQLDDFPNEFRPYSSLDPDVTINIPSGYTYVSATYQINYTPYVSPSTPPSVNGFPQFQNVNNLVLPVTAVSATTTSNGTTIRFHGLKGNDCWPALDDKFSNGEAAAYLQLDIKPTCDAPATGQCDFIGSYTENVQGVAGYQVQTPFSRTVPVYHSNPVIQVNAPSSDVNAYGNTATFDFQYCNTVATGANAAWVAFENSSFNSLDLSTATVTVTSGSNVLIPVVYSGNSLLVSMGALAGQSCVSLRLTANINGNGCATPGGGAVTDYLTVRYGNECSGATITSPDQSCEQGRTQFTFKRFPSGIQLTPVNGYPNTPVDLCDGLLQYNFIISANDLGNVLNPAFWVHLPTGISIHDIAFTDVAFTYPYGSSNTYPASSGLTAPPTGTYGSANDPGWDLSTYFTALGTASGGLPGLELTPSGTTNNQIGVTLTLQANCSYNLRDYISFNAGGISACNQPITAQTLFHRPTINNAPVIDDLSVLMSMTTTDNSSGLNCTNTGLVTITVTNNGFGTVQNNVLTVSVPGAPLIVSNYGSAATYNQGSNTISWNIPANTGTGQQTFTFNLNMDGTLTCPGNLPLSAVISFNQMVNCASSGGSCAAIYTSQPATMYINACCKCSMSLSATSTNVSCNGLNDGTATVTISTGTAPFTYSWNNGQTTATASGLTAGTYTVNVTDANGCIGQTTANISQPTALSATITNQSNVNCNGASTGSATVTALGGTGAYTYNWSPNGGNSATASNLSAGTYICMVTDANSCTTTAVVTITQPAALALATSSSNVMCNGGSTGSAGVSISGGNSPFTYSWSNGQTTATASGLTAGTYTVKVTDANSCTTNAVVTITQPAALTLVTSSSNVLCNGGSTGSAGVSVSGGNFPFTYSWSNGQTTATAGGLTAGTYMVKVTDANGCTGQTTANISQPKALSSNISSQTNVSCNGASTGSATINASGGTGTLTYSWSPSGGTSATASGLAAGTYNCTIKDSNACVQTQVVTITQPTAITSSVASQTNVNCNGASTGSATVNASGGTRTLTYSWSPSGGTSATASGLAAGTYTCTIKDANACAQTQVVTVTQPTAITLATTVTNITCRAGSTGAASVSVTGGTPGYTYSWTPTGGNTSTASNLSVGIYTVFVTDFNHCTSSTTVTITHPSALTLSISSTNVSCKGGANGSATATVIGGTGTYTYSWSPSGGNGSAAYGLAAGTYTCTVSNVNACAATQTVTITEPAGILNTFVRGISNVSCFGGNNGNITVTVSGGTPPYTYSWNPNVSNTGNAGNLTAGTYTCTVTDVNGCTSVKVIPITQPVAPLTLSVTSQNPDCKPSGTGSASVTVTGGTAAYAYLWSPSGGTAATANGLGAGTYTVHVTDANGCTANATVTIIKVTAPTVTVTANPSILVCAGTSVLLTAGGASSYSWNTGATSNPIAVTPLATTTYTVTGSNSTCSSLTAITVNIIPSPSICVSPDQSICQGSCVTLNASSCAGPALERFSWSPTSPAFTGPNYKACPSATTIYTVTAIGTLTGCTASKTITVTVIRPPVICLESEVMICSGTQTALNGACSPIHPGVTYSWTPGTGIIGSSTGSSVTVDPTTNITYTLTATLGGCSSTATCAVTMFPALSAFSITGPSHTQCGFSNTYSVSPVLPPPIMYTWHSTNPTMSGTGTTVSNVSVNYPGGSIMWTITDPNGGCGVKVLENIKCENSKEMDGGTEPTLDNKTGISVAVFPNPTDAALNVHITSDQKQEVNLCLYNSMGQLIHCEVLKGELSSIPTSTYPVGIYYYYITAKDGSLLKADKVVITH